MNSSYTNKIDFGTLIEGITAAVNPSHIVEVGILEGFSLEHLRRGSRADTTIQAYDIFQEFNGNHADKETLEEQFSEYPNVAIEYGDFYKLHEQIENVDIIHIDIANNGDVFEYAVQHYLPRLSEKGIMLLEGGSQERDNVEWMAKYSKPKIQPVVEKYGLKVVGTYPSITILS